MSSEHRPHENETVAYEHTDFSLGAIVWFFAGLTVALLVSAAFVGGLLWMFMRIRPSIPPEFPPLEEIRTQTPNLQPTPVLDFQRMRAEEMRRLSTYGWVDASANTVHIPIENAMRTLVERGMPAESLVPDSPQIPPVKSEPTIPPPLTRRGPDETAIQ